MERHRITLGDGTIEFAWMNPTFNTWVRWGGCGTTAKWWPASEVVASVREDE
jgi:hypothetical protein